MGWFHSSKKKEEPLDEEAWQVTWRNYLPREALDLADNLLDATPPLPPVSTEQTILLGVACSVSFVVGYRLGRVRPFWRPLTSLQDLNSNEIGVQAPWLRGRVVSVSDGDTIRFLHQPLPWINSATDHDKSHRLAIRLCTIDTPETAKFGKPGMAFGKESKQHLEQLCLNRTVRVQVLHMDQYGRGVASVYRPGWLWNQYLDEAMLKAGLAEVYTGSGAVYGRLGKQRYLELAESAQSRRLGIWSDPNRETAAEYKRRTS